MSEYGYGQAEDGQGDPFEMERRGYNRRQVDEFIARQNLQVRDLEGRMAQAQSQGERLIADLAEARQAVARAPHEEISDRVRKILELADMEGNANREKADAEVAELREIAKRETDQLRAEAKADTDKLRADAQNQAEKLLTAAKDQAEHTISGAVAQAEQLTAAAKAEAERTVGDANMHAENTVAAAIGQAKQQLDEATARAAAVHDGAERRLNLLISRHTETVRRLTEIRDVVTTLVAGETARGSLEDEVNRMVAASTGGGNGAGGNGEGRPGGRGEPAPSAAQRPDGHAEHRPVPNGGAEALRPPIPEAAEPLEELPAPPPVASRQVRPMTVHSAVQPVPRDLVDRPDQMGGRGPVHAPEGRHPTEPIRLTGDPIRPAADEARHAADASRHQAGGLGRPSLAPDREFDDTPVNGLAIDG